MAGTVLSCREGNPKREVGEFPSVFATKIARGHEVKDPLQSFNDLAREPRI